ncbi:MAG TPA: helix-turn-helix transcriptional regulator [Caulobacter sp.]|nr:helix-turn-helix transcriptional regulator [Caulobacter sp.]
MDDMEIYRQLGQNVARVRGKLGKTQAEIASQIGLTRASLANIETGRQKVLMHHVFRLANALECPSVLDLIPETFVFSDDEQPITTHGSLLSDQQHAAVQRFVQIAGKR